MNRVYFLLARPAINVTQNAWIKIRDILEILKNRNLSIDISKKNKSNLHIDNSFLFSATGGGCNGFNYNFELLEKKIFNEIILCKHSIVENDEMKVYIDPLSEIYLLGTTIDYQKENYSKGIYDSKFVFTPDKNKAISCGCGVSFSPKF